MAFPDDTRGILRPAEGERRFTLERRLPAPDLAHLVDRHWIVAFDLGDGSFTQTIITHPCVNLAIEPGRTGVWGIPLRPSPHTIVGRGMAIGTKFRPGGFSGFTTEPVHALSDRVAPLDEVFGDDGAALDRDLTAATGDIDRHISLVESFLRARLPEPTPQLALVAAVVDDMRTAGPAITVGDLADRHAVSPRTLQRLFRDHVGVGPKWVLQRYRIHDAAERIASGEAGDIVELALELGYFDQPHFTRDFTAQIGQSPAAYARACAAAAGRPVPA